MLLGDFAELEHEGHDAVARDRPAGAISAMSHGGEARFDRVGRAQVTPMFGREVVKREQAFAVFAQDLDGLRVLGSVGGDELVKRLVRLRAGRGGSMPLSCRGRGTAK